MDGVMLTVQLLPEGFHSVHMFARVVKVSGENNGIQSATSIADCVPTPAGFYSGAGSSSPETANPARGLSGAAGSVIARTALALLRPKPA